MESRWTFLDTARFWVDRYRTLGGHEDTMRPAEETVFEWNASEMYERATALLRKVYCQHGYTAMDSCPGCDHCEEYDIPIVWEDRN